MKIKKIINKIPPDYRNLFISFVVFIGSFLFYSIVFATTPNPGHSWAEVGDGTFQVSGPSTMRTYTFPDADSTILSSNSTVTVGEGGTGATTLTGILKGNGTSAFSAVTAPSGTLVGDTDSQTLTNKTISKASNTLTGVAGSGANSDITSLSALSTALTVGQGGTGLSTLTANNLLVGNGTSALSFLAPGTSGNILQSNGTSWESAAAASVPEVETFLTRNSLQGKALTNLANNGTNYKRTTMFSLPAKIVVNKISITATAVGTAGTIGICIYSADGSTLLIDEVTPTISAAGSTTVTLASPVTLMPGNYYSATGCATTCNITLNSYTGSSLTGFTSTPPTGKLAYAGNTFNTVGLCDTPMPAISGAAVGGTIIRLDN